MALPFDTAGLVVAETVATTAVSAPVVDESVVDIAQITTCVHRLVRHGLLCAGFVLGPALPPLLAMDP